MAGHPQRSTSVTQRVACTGHPLKISVTSTDWREPMGVGSYGVCCLVECELTYGSSGALGPGRKQMVPSPGCAVPIYGITDRVKTWQPGGPRFLGSGGAECGQVASRVCLSVYCPGCLRNTRLSWAVEVNAWAVSETAWRPHA